MIDGQPVRLVQCNKFILRCSRLLRFLFEDSGTPRSVVFLEMFPQHFEAFGDSGERVFEAFEFQGNVAAVIGISQNLGDSIVVDFQRVPLAATEICFGLDEDGFRGHLFKLSILIFQEVTRIGSDL